MTKNRRVFIGQLSLLAGAGALSKPLSVFASSSKSVYTLNSAEPEVTIYHTNELHGRLDAVYSSMGGLNHVKALLAGYKNKVALLDAGSFLGKSETYEQHAAVINVMNGMGYHAAAFGSHELALGADYLAQIAPLMKFTLVNCNYGFNSALNKFVKPFIIINTGDFKIGVTGVGQQVGGVTYNNAVESANRMAAYLKKEEKCCLVLCMANLGDEHDGTQDNKMLAKQSEQIDMVIGSHSPELLNGPVILRNRQKNEVILSQAAPRGLMIGKTVVGFNSLKQKQEVNAKYIIPGQPAEQKFSSAFYKICRP